MKLRRTDFDLHDYPKRKIWIKFKEALYDRELRDEKFLAWMMKRANSRALYIISNKCGGLKWLISIGIAIEKPKGTNRIAWTKRKMLIDRIKKSVIPETRLFLSQIAKESDFNNETTL